VTCCILWLLSLLFSLLFSSSVTYLEYLRIGIIFHRSFIGHRPSIFCLLSLSGAPALFLLCELGHRSLLGLCIGLATGDLRVAKETNAYDMSVT
jgi:hypothetical protein